MARVIDSRTLLALPENGIVSFEPGEITPNHGGPLPDPRDCPSIWQSVTTDPATQKFAGAPRFVHVAGDPPEGFWLVAPGWLNELKLPLEGQLGWQPSVIGPLNEHSLPLLCHGPRLLSTLT